MKSTILREAMHNVVSFYPPNTKNKADANGFESYCAPDAAIQEFYSTLDIGPCREDIEETIRLDTHNFSLPAGLMLSLAQHAFAIGDLPRDVLHHCATALVIYCDPGDPRREHGKKLLSSLESST
jgi:hypothetical protein